MLKILGFHGVEQVNRVNATLTIHWL